MKINNMFLTATLLSCFCLAANATESNTEKDARRLDDASRSIEIESSVVTTHVAKIKGQKVPYSATAGTQPVWDEDGKPIATLYYTYYQRMDVTHKDKRPLFISFNGGPGSASVWMHMAYTGPRILKVDDEGFPVQPYGIRDNPHSILDVADIVFVNPVNTGYSRIVDPNAKPEQFFGVYQDVTYLAEWINTFVTRANRWTSPKYLIGESYGTTRVSGLAYELQNKHWMYLNGVILVSPTWLGVDRAGPVASANRLPYFAAAAWYHNKLPSALQSKDLLDVLEEVEDYSVNRLLPVLAKGALASATERAEAEKNYAHYSGLDEKVIHQHNLDVPKSFFWKELLREQGLTIGRLDSRYTGIDRENAGASPDFNAELTSWLHSFTPAINHYFKNELKYVTDIKYNMFGPVHPWDRTDDKTGENLRQAMAMNPFLKVMTQSGYYDGGTTYINAKYNLWHLDPSGKMQDRLSFKGYRSGHMMYLRSEDLKAANDDLRQFINDSMPPEGVPAKY